jgi:hypothetical protein
MDGLRDGIPHWPLSSLARGPMGYSDAPGQGTSFPYDLYALGSGDYRLVWAGPDPRYAFRALELYLRGLASPDEVGEHITFPGLDASASRDGDIIGGGLTVGADDVIAAFGPRVPA